jgi:hypothetical protein
MLLRCESLEQRMSLVGQSRRFGDVCDMSALPPTTAVMMQCRERQKRAITRHSACLVIALGFVGLGTGICVQNSLARPA